MKIYKRICEPRCHNRSDYGNIKDILECKPKIFMALCIKLDNLNTLEIVM